MTIKGCLLISIPIDKAFLTRNLRSPVGNWRNVCVFFAVKWGRNVKFCFRNPPKHIFARNDLISRTDRENPCRGLD